MADRGARQIGGVGLRCTGALSGTVFVSSLQEATVGSLRAEILRLMSGGEGSVKLIVGGRTLQDDSKRLCDCGVSATSKVLVARGGAGDAAAGVNAAAERAARLERVRKAAEALAGRDGRGLSDDLALDIEDQAGARVAVRAEDRRNLVFGLVMHDKAKDTMRRGDWAVALEELLLAEEALGLCDPALTAAVDNVALLLLDLVWAAYKLGDLRRLAVSRERLSRARAGLERAHGADLTRLRQHLTGGAFSPELATYLRLEVLEGLVAFYGGEPAAAAEAAFRGAQAKWRRLQVSDGALAMLQGMGYDLKEARRGLRFSGGDVAAAVDFIQEQRAKQQERDDKRRKLHAWNYERIEYGKTAAGQYVDMEQLDKLSGLGYPRRLAAEALRKHENRGQDALDELAKPDRRRALELELSLKEALKTSKSKSKSSEGGAGAAAAEAVAGPSTSAAGGGAEGAAGSGAVSGAGGSAGVNPAALEALKSLAEALAASKGSVAAGGAGSSGGSKKHKKENGGAAAAAAAMDVDDETAAVALAAALEDEEGGGAPSSSSSDKDADKEEAEEVDPVKAAEKEELKTAERELVRHVQSDPMEAYDIDVTEEGNIIAEFLTLLSTGGEGSAA